MSLLRSVSSSFKAVTSTVTEVADAVTIGVSSLSKLAEMGAKKVNAMSIEQEENLLDELTRVIEINRQQQLEDFDKEMAKFEAYAKESKTYAQSKEKFNKAKSELQAKLEKSKTQA